MLRDYERTKLQKISLCVLLALAILFAALTAISRQHKGISFEEMFMEIEQQGDQTVYTGRKYGEDVTVVCYEEDGTDIVDFTVGSRYHFLGRLEHLEDTVMTAFEQEVPRIRISCNDILLFDGGYDGEIGMFFDVSGDLSPMIFGKAGYSSDPWYNYEFTANDIFYFANNPAQVARGSWAIYAFMVFFSLLAAIEIAFPENLFYLNHFLSVRDPEPSDFFWAMHRIGCVALPVLVLIGYIWGVRMVT